MTLILAYLAGVLTLINPCVLPVLPIVLASALSAHPRGPLALVAGMAVSFVVLGLGIAAAGQVLGLAEDALALGGAVALMLFGAVLLVPRLSSGFAMATGGMAARADAALPTAQAGLGGQALAGVLFGAVWSPCIGPTLGAAIGLAAGGGSLLQAGATMAAFAAGVATFALALAYGARAWMQRNRARLMGLARNSRPIMGAIFLATGIALALGLHKRAEAALIGLLPDWFLDLSISI
jgi:cytochrome c-type biogenesis protein